ncbi:unnamed protein product [Rotaria sordida]|uniref:Uncharacterized protein n=1 Tax=Rotaria sordida TaxID=392033 RepID=A0A814SRA0_9BILA|nr:unnamed protein product [Rotaria sordida]
MYLLSDHLIQQSSDYQSEPVRSLSQTKMNIKKLILFVIIGVTVASGVKVRVKNKCWWPLKVHIENDDNGRWIGAGGDSWGTNGRSDRTWAEQPGIWGDNTLAEINDDNGRIWYDISLVDGFTYPIALVPVGGGGGNLTA